MVELTGSVWVNPLDIVYIRPTENGGSYIELRTGRGWEDKRSPFIVARLINDTL